MSTRVLREQDQAAIDAMPTQLHGRMGHGAFATKSPPGRSKAAAAVVARAKLLTAQQWAVGSNGERAQVLFAYPDGECMYRQGECLYVGEVTTE